MQPHFLVTNSNNSYGVFRATATSIRYNMTCEPVPFWSLFLVQYEGSSIYGTSKNEITTSPIDMCKLFALDFFSASRI